MFVSHPDEIREEQQAVSLDRRRWLLAHGRLRALTIENLAHAPVSAVQLQKLWNVYSQELKEIDASG
ncbi:MAG: hypothetical protein WCD12_01685 [Candidatus Binatus sp.]|jgi:hypothetical protein|uniref:hypothetical protein n=1 Tax=Candidatus Binatus sp. TaxID=2811406 RepID=UPI003C7437DB